MSNKKVNIGISAGLVLSQSERFARYILSYVGDSYVQSAYNAGGVPIVLPVVPDEDVIRQQLENVSALIITGGDDVDPIEYNEEHQEKVQVPSKKRDTYDLALIKISQEMKIPTLCICRGHQIAAVYNGGTLYQDLSYAEGIKLKHDQYSNAGCATHKIQIKKESLLFDIIKSEEIWINSFHHQIIKDMPKGFKVTARSSDGAIEAMERDNDDYFFLSVQWHPEMMATSECRSMKTIFTRLNEEAIKFNNKKEKK